MSGVAVWQPLFRQRQKNFHLRWLSVSKRFRTQLSQAVLHGSTKDFETFDKKSDYSKYGKRVNKRVVSESLRRAKELEGVEEHVLGELNGSEELGERRHQEVVLDSLEGARLDRLLQESQREFSNVAMVSHWQTLDKKDRENKFYVAMEQRKFRKAIWILPMLAESANVSPASLVALWNGCFELSLPLDFQLRLFLAHIKLIKRWGHDAGYDLTRPFASYGFRHILENKFWTPSICQLMPTFVKASLTMSLKYADSCPLSARYVTVANLKLIADNISLCGGKQIYKLLVETAVRSVPYESRLVALMCVRKVFSNSGFPFSFAASIASPETLPLLLRLHHYVASKPRQEFVTECLDRLFANLETVKSLPARRTAVYKLGLDLLNYFDERHLALFDQHYPSSFGKAISELFLKGSQLPQNLLNYAQQRQTPNTLAIVSALLLEKRVAIVDIPVTHKFRLKSASSESWASCWLVLNEFYRGTPSNPDAFSSLLEELGVELGVPFYHVVIEHHLRQKNVLLASRFAGMAQSSLGADVIKDGHLASLLLKLRFSQLSKAEGYWSAAMKAMQEFAAEQSLTPGTDCWDTLFSGRSISSTDSELAELLVWLFNDSCLSQANKSDTLKSIVANLPPEQASKEFYGTLWCLHKPADMVSFVDFCVAKRLHQAGRSFSEFFGLPGVDPRLYIIQNSDTREFFACLELIRSNLTSLDKGWVREELVRALRRFAKDATLDRNAMRTAFFSTWELFERVGYPQSYAQWCRVYQSVADHAMMAECRIVWSHVCAWFNSCSLEVQRTLLTYADWSFMWNAQLKAVILCPTSTFRDITNTFEMMNLAGVSATEVTWVSLIGACREKPQSCDRFWSWLCEREASKINLRTETARLNNLQFTKRMDEFWDNVHLFVHRNFPSYLRQKLLRDIPPRSKKFSEMKLKASTVKSDDELAKEMKTWGYAFFSVWLDAVYHNYGPEKASALGQLIMLDKYVAVARTFNERRLEDNVVCSFFEGQWKVYKATSNFLDFVLPLQQLKRCKEFCLGPKSKTFLRKYISGLPSAVLQHKQFVRDFIESCDS